MRVESIMPVKAVPGTAAYWDEELDKLFKSLLAESAGPAFVYVDGPNALYRYLEQRGRI